MTMTMTMTNPDRILRTLPEVPPYLLRRYGETVTRQTIYNWRNIGRRGIKLRTTTKSMMSNRTYTTWEWVRDFLKKTQ